jgi:hypothetical protein
MQLVHYRYPIGIKNIVANKFFHPIALFLVSSLLRSANFIFNRKYKVPNFATDKKRQTVKGNLEQQTNDSVNNIHRTNCWTELHSISDKKELSQNTEGNR